MEAYKGSQFNLFIPMEDSEECLIFNTSTGKEMGGEGHLKATIENGRPLESISSADRSNPEQLKEMGIMVNDMLRISAQIPFALSIMAENLS